MQVRDGRERLCGLSALMERFQFFGFRVEQPRYFASPPVIQFGFEQLLKPLDVLQDNPALAILRVHVHLPRVGGSARGLFLPGFPCRSAVSALRTQPNDNAGYYNCTISYMYKKEPAQGGGGLIRRLEVLPRGE